MQGPALRAGRRRPASSGKERWPPALHERREAETWKCPTTASTCAAPRALRAGAAWPATWDDAGRCDPPGLGGSQFTREMATVNGAARADDLRFPGRTSSPFRRCALCQLVARIHLGRPGCGDGGVAIDPVLRGRRSRAGGGFADVMGAQPAPIGEPPPQGPIRRRVDRQSLVPPAEICHHDVRFLSRRKALLCLFTKTGPGVRPTQVALGLRLTHTLQVIFERAMLTLVHVARRAPYRQEADDEVPSGATALKLVASV